MTVPPDDRTPITPEVVPSSPDPDPSADPMADPMSALMGGGDLSNLLQAAQDMQAELVNAQAQAADTVVEGVSGGGAVRIQATAGLEFRAVHLRPDAVDGNDVEMLEDLVLAALRDVVTQANQVQVDALGDLGDLGGLGGMLPGS